MKKTIVLSFLAILSSIFAYGQKQTNQAEVTIQTSAKCEMCKKRIERDLSLQKGITKADLNLDNKAVTVSYNPKKTDVEKIKQAISMIGYDADEVIANEKSHNNLPECCQKTTTEH